MIRIFLSTLLTLFIYVKFPKVPSQQRWFLRFFYLGKWRQLKYWYQDFFKKEPYKVIRFEGEFQQELIKVLPHAYWHYQNGTLLRTESPKYMTPFYFFSPNHREVFSERNYENNLQLDIPNSAHNIYLDTSKWKPVPLKEHYQNNVFKFSKPTLIIANRYNTEWGRKPISYFDIETLRFFLNYLSPHFQIIYNRPRSEHIANDNSEVLNLNEHQMIEKEFPETIMLEDLFQKYQQHVLNFNHLQLMVYANCEYFISVHGGTATLASCFGGRNLIYSVEGHEHVLNEFENVFSQLSGAIIMVARNIQDLKNTVRNSFYAF